MGSDGGAAGQWTETRARRSRLTYAHLPTGVLLGGLLALAILEAALGVMFFMHLRYERRALFWSLIPGLIFVLLMMNQLWPDAYRLASLHH
jgi:cytochrome c oxidase subunit IV